MEVEGDHQRGKRDVNWVVYKERVIGCTWFELRKKEKKKGIGKKDQYER